MRTLPAFGPGRLFVAGLLAFAVVLRAIETFGRPLQVDEAYSLWLARLPFSELFARLTTHDVHPPLFFLALHPFSAAGFPDWFFRSIVFVFSLASLAAFYWIVRLWASERAARIALIAAALMPSLMFYDSWIRMYALFHFEVLLSFLLLSVLLTQDSLPANKRRALWVGWAACSIAAWYTIYLGLVVTAAQLLYLALVRRDGLGRGLIGTAATFALWLPQLPTFAHQQRFGGVAFANFRGHEALAIGLLPGNAVFAQLESTTAAFILSALIWIWGAAALYVAARTSPRSLLLWLGMPSALLVMFSLLAGKLLYGDRYHLLLAFALAAWSGIALAALWERMPRVAGGLSLAGTAAMIALAATRVLNPAYTTAPWPTIANFLKANDQRGDLLVLDQGNSLWILDRYGAIAGHPAISVFGQPAQSDAAKFMSGHARVWYVGFQSQPVDPSEVLLNYLLRHWKLTGTWRYDRNMVTEQVFVARFVR